MGQQYNFGSGNLIAKGSDGNAFTFAALQDVNIDISGDVKELRGQKKFALDIAMADVKIDIKAGSGSFDIDLYNTLFFGLTAGANSRAAVFAESGTIPGTPYQVTVANGATFYADLGVYFTLTGKRLVRVVSGPTTGQYSVNVSTGVYTFAAADTTIGVKISYLYSVAGTGKILQVTNSLMGTIPTFSLIAANIYKGQQMGFEFKSVICPKISFPLKRDDFTIGDLEFSAQDDGLGNVMDLWQSST